MKRTAATAALLAAAGMALLSAPTAAAAAPAEAPDREDVAIVDEPDTGDLHDEWTFAPLGVPVFGLVDSVLGVPGELL